MSENSKNGHSMKDVLGKVEFDLKHNMVINRSPMSLQYLSLSKIANSLWKSHLKRFDTERLKKFSYHNVRITEFDILCSIRELEIPKSCKDLLESMIRSTGEEITENLLVTKLIEFKKFNLYPDNLYFNKQGDFSILKTAIKIINETNLSNLEKFELACDFCLKDKIWDLRNKLSEKDIKNLENKETFTLVAFWLLYIKDEELSSLIKGVEPREYLRKCLTEIPQNEIALQYIWENFADETWKEHLVDIVTSILEGEMAGNNIAFYFFKQMNKDQLEEMRSELHFPVLMKLFTISKWNNVVSVQEYAFDLIKSFDMYDGFSVIRYCWFDGNFLNLEDLITMWNQFVQHFKLDLEKSIVKFYNKFKLGDINACKEGLLIQLIIRVVNSEKRRKLIYSRTTMLYCQRLLCQEIPQALDLFLNQILKEKDISHFKKEFFRVMRMDLCANLIIDRGYAVLDRILIKFCTDESVSEFKKKYCLDILSSVLKNARGRRGKLLTIISKYLSWCFNDSKKEIERYKALAFDLDSNLYIDIRKNFFIILKSFINRGKWNLVRKYWKWILSANKQMGRFDLGKKILFATYGEESSLTYLQNKNCHGLLRRFITTCFNLDEVEEIKEELQHKDDLSFFVKEMIERENLQEVEDILEWSFSSTKNKIADFKSRFMNSYGRSLLFHFIERYNDTEKAKRIITWFNPSAESAESFKKNFLDYVEFRISSINLGLDREIKDFQNNERKILIGKINFFVELLNCYRKRKYCVDKNTSSQDSKKRKTMEE